MNIPDNDEAKYKPTDQVIEKSEHMLCTTT